MHLVTRHRKHSASRRAGRRVRRPPGARALQRRSALHGFAWRQMPVQPDYEVTLAKAVELLKEIVETEAPGAAAADAILAKWAQLR